MADPASDVQREEGPNAGRFFIPLGPGAEAEMTYRLADGTMIVTHTGVPRAFEGRGIAASLVRALIADARAQGRKITPLCSYVASQFRRHPEWSDLLA
ncbi:GNAT family N-acetyltransferase [Xanthobacter sp. KR7-65]|uniref:GNAT family N-acetyltransferase n=1 Tax=Xanthobacter sp. KR7-65 TaxID=3156612 RepID=UPI0032B60E5D